jgi:hypothetical protein
MLKKAQVDINKSLKAQAQLEAKSGKKPFTRSIEKITTR